MHPRYAKRQNTDITAMPSASGISGSRTAGDPSGTQLVVGTNTGLSITDGPDFAPGTSLVVTLTMTNTQKPSQTPSESPALSGAKSVIPLSTVIGVCIGAFVGAGFLICLSIWFYRRFSRRPSPRARQKQPLAQSRGVNPSSPWTKFDEEGDKWGGQNEMTEKRNPGNVALAPGTLRMTSPHPAGESLTNGDHLGSQHNDTSQPLQFSQYHSKLAEQMALDPSPAGVDQPRRSLDGSTTGSFLSLAAVRIETGKMSPTFNVAKVTPPATASKLHQWEIAEVIDPDAHAQEVEIHSDPFSEKSTPTTYSPTETFEDRRSLHNPFFNAHPGSHSRHPSVVRKSSAMSISSDPFNKDEEMLTMPKPKFISHTVHDSSSSGGSFGNERSMQSLIAALELPQEIIEERLRVASMNPSEASRYSTATDGYTMPTPDAAERGFVAQ